MEGYRGGIGAVSPPVTWDGKVVPGELVSDARFVSGESGDKDNVHIIHVYIHILIYRYKSITFRISTISMIRNQKFFWGSEQAYIRLYSLHTVCRSMFIAKTTRNTGELREVRHFCMASIAQRVSMLTPTFVPNNSYQLETWKNINDPPSCTTCFLFLGWCFQMSFSSSLVLMRSVQCWTAVWCEHHLLHIGGAHPLLGLVGSVFKRHFGMPGIGMNSLCSRISSIS